ncbi:putative mitochondrial protein [Cardamine amara subsp. amara]|uniref:Mitochondrial protein n=1 Tax=Cardamine amara subsp. amara TaxID=228776 RepID=A0ABD1C730_CARAN
MKKSEDEGRISGLMLTENSQSIQHLLFVNDSLFLCRATFKEGAEILRCLKVYGEAYGLEINFQKSSITFGKKLDPIMINTLGLYMDITQEGGAEKHLGLPECFNGSKRELLAFVTDKLKARLSGWYANTLSLGGKEVLLKSVAMVLPVYAMSCFKLTKFQCEKITSGMTSFWWNTCEEKNKIHWVSWEKMCKSKSEGGLGFRDIEQFNLALLAKQAWRLLSEPQSLLSRLYKAKYYADNDFIEPTHGSRPSYAWRSILYGRELLERGVMKSIRDGTSTRIWLDKWVMDTVPRRPMNRETRLDLRLLVSDLVTEQGLWDLMKLNELFLRVDVDRIMSYPPNMNYKDEWIWTYSKDGKYNVKSGSWLVSQPIVYQEPLPAETHHLNRLKSKIWKVDTIIQIF